MAAVMLASGIHPREAADFASKVTWGMVADPPGLGGYVKGRFELNELHGNSCSDEVPCRKQVRAFYENVS